MESTTWTVAIHGIKEHRRSLRQTFCRNVHMDFKTTVTLAVFTAALLVTTCKATVSSNCSCTPNANNTTTLTLSMPLLSSTCKRQWLYKNGIVQAYNEDFNKATVFSLTNQSIITEGCPEEMKYKEDCTKPVLHLLFFNVFLNSFYS